MFMFSCCFIFSCCCFCLSVLNLFPVLESSPSSLPAWVLWGAAGSHAGEGPMEKVLCPLGEPGPMLLVWPAGDLRAQSLPADQWVGGTAGCYSPSFWPHCLVEVRIKDPRVVLCTSWAHRCQTGSTQSMRRRAHRLLPAASRVSKRVFSSSPERFLVRAGGFPAWLGWRCRLQGSATSMENLAMLGRAGTVPKERCQMPWTAKPKQQQHSMPRVTPGFISVHTSTSPPWSFSCALPAALTLQHCPWGRASRAVPSMQPRPLPRLLGTECFWDLCSSLGYGLGQMGFAAGWGESESAWAGPRFFSYREILAKKTPAAEFPSWKEMITWLAILNLDYFTSYTWKKSWLFTEKLMDGLNVILLCSVHRLCWRDHFFPGSVSQSKQRLIPHWKEAGPSWCFILMAKKHKMPLCCRSFSKMFAALFSQAHQRGQTWS